MADTKRGRERKGRKKREQLEQRLARRDARLRDADDEPDYPPSDVDADLLDPTGGGD